MELKPTRLAPPIPQQAARTVFGLGGCFALGNFTDNLFKQCTVLLAAKAQLPAMQSCAMALCALPFILCSAWAGWLADRFPKKRLAVSAKCLELGALCLGALMLFQEYWPGILLVLFLLGLQAAFLSPALNGAIPENFPAVQVPKINALVKLASTLAVLGGVVSAGFLLDYPLFPENANAPWQGLADWIKQSMAATGGMPQAACGRALCGLCAATVALLGLLLALSIPRRPRCGPTPPPFPLAGPLDSVRHALAVKKDPPLLAALYAEAFFYGIAAVSVVSISNLSISLGYSESIAGLLSAAFMSGIAAGALAASSIHPDRWAACSPKAAWALAGGFLLISASATVPGAPGQDSWQLSWLFLGSVFCGFCGGVYLIPLASFIQIRPALGEKGRILGISNFLTYVFIACCGLLFYAVTTFLDLAAHLCHLDQQQTLLLPLLGVFPIYALGMGLCGLYLTRQAP